MTHPIAIITGATSGLGRAYASHLAEQGWDLLLTGRRNDRLESIQKYLTRKYAIEVKICSANLLDSNDLRLLINTINKLPTIDMLINNAGFGCREDFYTLPYSKQDQMLQVHITAASQLIHEIVPIMKKQNSGTIINVASLCAYLPAPLSYFYCSSKAFLVSLSECMHIDLHKHHIKVQALCPGFIETEFHSRMGIKGAHSYIERKLLWMNEGEVVKSSVRHLTDTKVICIPGLINRLIYHIAHLLPKRLYYYLTAIQAQKLKANIVFEG